MDDDQELSPEFRKQADLLLEKVEPAEQAAQKIGLYLEGSSLIGHEDAMGAHPALVLGFVIGDLAFAPRTQDPEQDQFDRQFREMEVSMEDQEFAARQKQILEAIERGEDPLDGD